MTDEGMELAKAFKRLFSSEDGVKVLNHLSRFCMEKRSTFCPGAPDMTAFNEGGRTVILEIRKKMELDLSKAGEKEEAANG